MTVIKYILIIVSIMMLFALTSNEAKAQCPSGYTYYELPMNINGCDYIIQVCVQCGTGPVPAKISLIGIIFKLEPACVQQWSFDQVTAFVRNTINAPHFVYNTFCQQYWQIPNCITLPPKEVHYTEPICWNITKVSYFGQDALSYSPCDDSYCKSVYEICFNPITQQYEQTFISLEIMGDVTCTLGIEEIDIPIEYNEPTECFVYPTLCD